MEIKRATKRLEKSISENDEFSSLEVYSLPEQFKQAAFDYYTYFVRYCGRHDPHHVTITVPSEDYFKLDEEYEYDVIGRLINRKSPSGETALSFNLLGLLSEYKSNGHGLQFARNAIGLETHRRYSARHAFGLFAVKAAQEFQQANLNKIGPPYDTKTRSCVTHAADVLRKGGFDVPKEPGA